MLTKSERYTTFESESGRWYFHPTEPDWLTFNANDSFSRSYGTEAEALEAAEAWEEQEQWEEQVRREEADALDAADNA